MATDAIRSAYHEGRGSLPVRGKVAIEGDAVEGSSTANGIPQNGTPAGKAGKGKAQKRRDTKPAIVITELPYQTNKVSQPLAEPILLLLLSLRSLSFGLYSPADRGDLTAFFFPSAAFTCQCISHY